MLPNATGGQDCPKCPAAASGAQCTTQSQTLTRPTAHSVSHTPHASTSTAGPSSVWTSPPRAGPGMGSAQHSMAQHRTCGIRDDITRHSTGQHRLEVLQASCHYSMDSGWHCGTTKSHHGRWSQMQYLVTYHPPFPLSSFCPSPSAPLSHTLQAVLLSMRSANSLQAGTHTQSS